MATALDIIKRAMRLTGALGGGETPTADEQTDGLTALNSMLESWSIQSLAIYQVQDESFTWASGNTTQTMGSAGDFNTTRPSSFEGFFQRVNSVDYPIHIASEEQYSRIADKSTQSSLISWIYPDMANPLITLYAYPVPSSNATVHIRSWKALQSFSTAATALAMPPGYQDALTFNLAVILADEYQRPVPPMVLRRAITTLRAIKVLNKKVRNMISEPAFLRGGGAYDWRTGDA